MEVPLGIGLFLVEPVAENPEPAAAHILDPVIIAGEARPIDRAVAPLPPFGRDPLGTLEPTYLMEGAAPAEAMRRAVGHLGNHLDRLRRVEQMQGKAERVYAMRHPAWKNIGQLYGVPAAAAETIRTNSLARWRVHVNKQIKTMYPDTADAELILGPRHRTAQGVPTCYTLNHNISSDGIVIHD